MESWRLPRPLAGSSVFALLDKLYSRPNRLAACVPQLPAGLVRQISDTYDVVDAMATDCAACALERISSRGGAISTAPLTPAEHFRFRRAFYRVELYYSLLRCDEFAGDVNDMGLETMKRWFFWRHPPWENEAAWLRSHLPGDKDRSRFVSLC